VGDAAERPGDMSSAAGRRRTLTTRVGHRVAAVLGLVAGLVAISGASWLPARDEASSAPPPVQRPPSAAQPGVANVTLLALENGSRPFVGDGPLRTTVTPNGDGLRERAVVHFGLDRAATVQVDALVSRKVQRGEPVVERVWSARRRLRPGRHAVGWRPAPTTPPGTYMLRVVAHGARNDAAAARRALLDGSLPVVRVLHAELALDARSYGRGEVATARIATDATALELQVFGYAAASRGAEDVRTGARAVGRPVRVDWRRFRDGARLVRLPFVTARAPGFYVLRLRTEDGRLAYAPYVVRAVAVVLPTTTWQAYNFHDGDRDGWGDSWYVRGKTRAIALDRPYAGDGLPAHFRDWERPFLRWLRRTARQVEFLTDDDLAEVPSGGALARRYQLVVFAGHEEYVTKHVFEVVKHYRDLGGNLLFLSANNLFWQVRCRAGRCAKVARFRALGTPEASVVGVQYVANNAGRRQAPYVLGTGPTVRRLLPGPGLRPRGSFGRYGIEIDARTPASPRSVRVLATSRRLIGRHSAEMTYYETQTGARVFAAGVVNFTASLSDPAIARLLENVWRRTARD
jgi:N,N-dimethylformamidase beta subunit-like, C-terminal